MIAWMDVVGIEKLIVCAWHHPSGWLISNDDVAAEPVSYAPDRFVGVAPGDLARPMIAVREVHELNLAPETQQLFLFGNSRRVFGL